MLWVEIWETVHGAGNFVSKEVTKLEIESGMTEWNGEISALAIWAGVSVNADAVMTISDSEVRFRRGGAPGLDRLSEAAPSSRDVSNRELIKTWKKTAKGHLPLEAVFDRIMTGRVISHAERLALPPLSLSIEVQEAAHLKDGPAGEAEFGQPYSVAVAPDGTVYVADQLNHAIRRITPDRVVSTVAGGEAGFADGPGHAARFAFPSAIALGPDGVLYVADTFNHRLRRIRLNDSAYPVETVAGWYPGQSRVLHFPQGVAVAPDGTVYVADSWNHRICRLVPGGQLEPFVGEWGKKTGQFNRPYGLAVDAAGNLYVADSLNDRICRVTSDGQVKVLAGKEEGFADGKGSKASFYHPYGLAIDGAGDILVADTWNHRIRRVSPKGEVTTIAGGTNLTGSTWPDLHPGGLSFPHGVGVLPDGRVVIANTLDHDLRLLARDGQMSLFAGAPQTEATRQPSPHGFYDQ